MSRACPDDYENEQFPPQPVLKWEMSSGQLRELGKAARKREFTSLEADAFVTLYRRELDELLNQTTRDFIIKKVGK
jgi:hypothetical protein